MKKYKKCSAFFLFVFFCFFILSVKNTFAADWLSGWQYRKEITILKTNVGSDLTNFPLLVKISDDTDIGTNISNKTNGYDIRFTDSDDNLLAYEREDFSDQTLVSATGDFWVKVPTVNSSSDPLSTKIYIYYGNSLASTTNWMADTSTLANCTTITNAQCVWKEDTSQNYSGVWHLKETGTNPTTNDSTSNANNSATQTWSPTTSGKIGRAGSFNGSSNSINITSNEGLNPASITVSAWVKADVNNKWQYAVLKDGQWDFGRDNGVDNGASGIGRYYLAAWNSTTNVADEHASVASTGTWEYIVFTYDGSKAKYYVDTSLVIDKTITGNLKTSDANINLGSQAATGNFWDGLIDEVKISNTARSADWIDFEYHNQADTGNELTFNIEESAPILVTDITVSAADSVTTVVNGDTLQMSADILPADASNQTVGWSVTNETGLATIDSSGLLTATSEGTVTVIASATDGSGITGTKQITVTNPVSISAPPNRSGGSSIRSRVANLLVMGNQQAAGNLMNMWPSLFPADPTSNTTTKQSFTWFRDLAVGAIGEDVRQLQIFLNNNGFVLVSTGPGSLGNETSTFGLLTRAALIRFQESNNIKPSLGYFGPITRVFIQSIL